MTLKEKFAEYDKKVPKQVAHLKGGDFAYRYYKNPNVEKEITLVLLAGGSGLGEGMFYMIDSFKDKYSTITFNYPMDYKNNAVLADAIAELLKQTGAKNIYLVGQSYGGLIAQITARRHPDIIKGLILSGTCSLSGDINFEGMKNIVEMIHPKKVSKNIKKDKHLPIFLLAPMFKLMIGRVIKDKKLAKDFAETFDICRKDLSNEYFVLMDMLLGDLATEFGSHKPEDFETFRNEVLIFFSDEDKIFCDNLKDALVRLMPDPVVKKLDGGHLAMAVDGEKYIRELDEFLAARN